MNLLVLSVFLIILFVAELAYFKIADRYNIIDKPNHRSSHTQITIRGGGIIFPVSLLLWFFSFDLQYPVFISGLLIISVISFIDDLNDVSRKLRMVTHIVAVSLAFYQFHLFAMHWWLIFIAYLLVIGAINAYNFMDGINGITGIYSLVLVTSLSWVNQYQFKFIDNSLLIVLILSLIVFLFFNFRKTAACFAGDVGSISIAFIVCFLLIKLIVETSQPCYIFMLSVYGIDAMSTIFIRIARKENIFEAHRVHLYQLLVNQHKLPHLTVSMLYGAVQILINFFIICIIKKEAYFYMLLLIILLLFLYIFGRLYIEVFLKKVNKKL